MDKNGSSLTRANDEKLLIYFYYYITNNGNINILLIMKDSTQSLKPLAKINILNHQKVSDVKKFRTRFTRANKI